jgi:hypothetical protein
LRLKEGAMFRLPFGRRGEVAATSDLADADEIWELPDMEPAGASDGSSLNAPAFGYEDAPIHPAGLFTAEFVAWRPLDGRAAWLFRSLSEPGAEPLPYPPLPFLTGTVCRPDNHLSRLALALQIVSGIRSPEDLQRAASRLALEEALATLEPDSLRGRRCRIEVEHVRDDVGDTSARIRDVHPLA